MGYTSYEKKTDKNYNLALITGKDLVEASQLGYFLLKKYAIAEMFDIVEICSNGRIILKNTGVNTNGNYINEFAVFE